MGGLVQRVPAGELSLEATLQRAGGPLSCTQPFTAAAGDRLILRLQLGSAAGADCAQVESVEDWVANRTGPTGVDYVGLTQAEADDRARAAGLTTRVVAADGMDLAVTMDFRPDRLNLMLFDGVVVAAQLDGEQAVPADQGTLAVDLEPVEGMFIEGFDVTLQFYDSGDNLLSERVWSESVTSTGTTAAPGDIDPHYTHVLREPVPPGTVRLVTVMRIGLDPEGPRCETTVDVGEADVARVTLLFAADERGACASVAAANAEADQLLGMPAACRRPVSWASARTRPWTRPPLGDGLSACWPGTARAGPAPMTISPSASTSCSRMAGWSPPLARRGLRRPRERQFLRPPGVEGAGPRRPQTAHCPGERIR